MNAHVAEPLAAAVRTTCPYCGVGCGVIARPDGLAGAAIEGDPEHPSNFGRLCSKGSALGETLGRDGRLLHPMIEGRRASWDAALTVAAEGFTRIAAEHGPDAVAFYLSGQLLTEDYYVANKLMKGFIGSSNVDTNSRLCMASSVAGHRRAFGADTVPGCYEDLDEADLVVLVGSNAAWCHPILFRRMLDARARRGTKIVIVDPRRTTTGDEADLFLPIAPGTDAALFSGLLVHLAEAGALDRDFIESHTTGFAEALARAREIAPTTAATARATGLPAPAVQAFFELFAAAERTVTCFSQGVNQAAQGTDKVNAIINCHLATGRIGRPGTGPFSLTGQPNAMGGREVGGLANMLAAHMGFSPEEIDRVRRFWGAPRMAEREGLKAVALFEAAAAGRVKALWIMATNPAVSLPAADGARDALRKLDLLVVSENVIATDTIARGAHVLFPAAAWGEKDGTVTNSERRISRQRAFLPLPGDAKPDWWILAEVAKRMGFGDAFAYRSAADIFWEHAALSAFENDGARDFDIGGLAELGEAEYESLEPLQWPVPAGSRQGRARFFAKGGFFTPRLPLHAQHRPRAGSVAHHDAHREDASAHRAPAGALRRGEPGRRGATEPAARRPRAGLHRPRRRGARGRSRGGAATRVAVRADSLEQRELFQWANRSARPCSDRSVLRPARREEDAGRDRAGAREDARLRAVALAAPVARRARGPVVGEGRGRRRVRHAVRDDACGTRHRRMGAGPVLRRGARRVRR
jgi:assimilatory nitrate reductase catalytic subunit